MKPSAFESFKRIIKSMSFILLYLFSVNQLQAQDTIRSLVITEARLQYQFTFYVEFTNMGDEPVELSQFEIGKYTPWEDLPPFAASPNNFARLPEKILLPGESYLMCSAHDYNPEQFELGYIEIFEERTNKPDLLEIADYVVHLPESANAPGDSVDWKYSSVFAFDCRFCLYLEQHLPNGDSIVVDQVNGIFDGPNGAQHNEYGNDVAGYPYATNHSTIIRKFNIKEGNTDFFNARGIGEEDSEWIVVPNHGFVWRKLYWTAGNHLNAQLNDKTLEPTTPEVEVDFVNKTITVPWGIQRHDDVMNYFKPKPGIAWNYHRSTNPEDSLSNAAKTGDQLEIYVCGNKVQKATFTIIVKDPLPNANQVNSMADEWMANLLSNGYIDWPRITRHASGNDTIWGWGGGIPYATRTDSLLERLEKAPNASWEFEWANGTPHPDLKEGDVLKVTAENGEVKRYYISVLYELKSHNAYLSSITWPDIPQQYRGIYGWSGDTIPGFIKTKFNYQLKVPYDVEGIPALVAKTEDANAYINVQHAKNLSGTIEDRTITIRVTAEDDSTMAVYTVELIKEKAPENMQPYVAEPFLSELCFWDQWSNSFGEICNPGTAPLDLSDYMMAMSWNPNPAEVIESRMGENEWLDRYDKYVPGYKWVNKEEWKVNPGILEPDLNVNSIILPGDVFCFGAIYSDWLTPSKSEWPVVKNLDVQFNNYKGSSGTYYNPWYEPVSQNGSPIRKWNNAQWYLFKILNDSIKLGLKPANDPNDFELIDCFGMNELNKTWIIAGEARPDWMITTFIRKPEITFGNPMLEESFGTNIDDSEWTIRRPDYFWGMGLNYVERLRAIVNDIGQHSFNPPTRYISTVSSGVYKISPGYSHNEKIWGVLSETTVTGFLQYIIKHDEGQTLNLVSGEDGSILPSDAILNLNDTLMVLSADSVNTTKYILDVSDDGLNSHALLTSDIYLVTVHSQPKSAGNENQPGEGSVSGMEYGTTLKTVLANIRVPAGANLNVINKNGEFVPTIKLNYDTSYIDVIVKPGMFFRVVAEDGATSILYQIEPESSTSDAFLLSDVYHVIQKDFLVEFVPRGTNVRSFLANVTPSMGATVQILDKLGNQRFDGKIYQDDEIVVTSADGLVTNVYFLSMLRTQSILQTTYLAYILSDIYTIDQVNNTVLEVPGDETIAEFMGNISTAPGASAIVVDALGNDKLSGEINMGDRVQVTSADGKTTVWYSLLVTGVNQLTLGIVNIYPNPTNGKVTITGLESGSLLNVYNIAGNKVVVLNKSSKTELLDLTAQPAGLYIVEVNSGKRQNRFKVIKK